MESCSLVAGKSIWVIEDVKAYSPILNAYRYRHREMLGLGDGQEPSREEHVKG